MDMKKVIAIGLLAVGFLAWRMGAMEQKTAAVDPDQVILNTSDNKEVPVSQADARFFVTVEDLIDALGNEQPIPLKNVTESVLRRLIADLPWARRVRMNR